MTFEPNNEDHCFCSHCSEVDTFETVMRATEKVLESENPEEIIDILFELSEYSKIISLREYLFTNMIDQDVILESLEGITFEDEYDIESDEELEYDIEVNLDVKTEGIKHPKRGYWNTPFSD